MSLVERKPGRPDGRRMLDGKREEIIRAARPEPMTAEFCHRK